MKKKDAAPRKPEIGVKAAADLLSGLDPDHRERLMKNVSLRDPQLADRLERELYGFEDLAGVDDREFQALLAAVPEKVLALALRRATDVLRTKVISNLTQRAGERLLETMAVQGLQKVTDVQLAQEAVLTIARRLQGEGKLVLRKPTV